MKPKFERYMDMGRTIRDIRNPGHFEENLFRQIGEGLDPIEREITQSILSNFKCRAAAIGFFTDPLDIPPQERLGAIFFVGLVFAADDTIDQPSDFRNYTDPNLLRSALLSQKASISGKPIIFQEEEITIGEIMERTLSKFPKEKQQMIGHFLDDMIRNETEIENRTPGSYSYESALSYREKTSDSFVRTGMKLMGIDNEAQIERSVTYARVAQMIDDAMDVSNDFRDLTINPLIALAYENGEGDILSNIVEGLHLEKSKGVLNSIRIIRNAQNILKQLPKTREQYLSSYHGQLNQLPKGPFKMFLETVGRAIL